MENYQKDDASKNYERIMSIFNEKIQKLQLKNNNLQQELSHERVYSQRAIEELKVNNI